MCGEVSLRPRLIALSAEAAMLGRERHLRFALDTEFALDYRHESLFCQRVERVFGLPHVKRVVSVISHPRDVKQPNLESRCQPTWSRAWSYKSSVTSAHTMSITTAMKPPIRV